MSDGNLASADLVMSRNVSACEVERYKKGMMQVLE